MECACYFCPLQVKIRRYRQFVARVTLLMWVDGRTDIMRLVVTFAAAL